MKLHHALRCFDSYPVEMGIYWENLSSLAFSSVENGLEKAEKEAGRSVRGG